MPGRHGGDMHAREHYRPPARIPCDNRTMSSRSFFRRPAVLLILALCAVAAVVSILSRLAGGPDSAKKPVPLAAARGAEAYPSFSPDGKRLAYSARPTRNGGFHVFIRDLPSGEERQLTAGNGSDIGPVWSPDGASIAFLRLEEEGGACMVVPAAKRANASAGAEERKVADCAPAAGMDQPFPAAAWTPDGKSLAVVVAAEDQLAAIALVPAEGGAPKRLTNPPQGSQGDSTPAVSPDGKTVAFVRSAIIANDAADADIFTCDLQGGNLQRLTFDGRGIRGIAWTPDGSHLVYAGYRMGSWRLWRLPAAGGSPRDLGFARENAQYPAAASAGGRLAYTNSPSVSAVWRAELGGDASKCQSLIRSPGREAAPAYSPDGRKIADISDQTGADEIWVSDADGGHRAQLTRFKGRAAPNRPLWSPDGQTLLFTLRAADVPEVDTVPAAGGEPKRVLLNGSGASWSHDGKSIYYQSRGGIWKAPAAGGGDGQALTAQGNASLPDESPDGKYVYYAKWGAIWRVPAGGGAEEEAFQSQRGTILGGALVTAKGAYYVEFDGSRMGMRGGGGRNAIRALMSASPSVCFFDFTSRKSTQVFELQGLNLSGISISPDARYILYPRVDQSETNLMLVEGFR